jgi:cytochrome oxidase assembly protein ShyY1
VSALRLALSPRWLGYLAVAVAFAVLTALFGMWQWDRREQAVAESNRIQNNYDQEARPLEEIMPPGSPWSEELTWVPVVVRGEYLPEHQLLVRTRPRAGHVGFNLVVPLRDESGNLFLVDRGWVPTGATQDAPDMIPEPPPGQVTVVMRLFGSEPELPGRSAPEGQVASIALGQIADMEDIDLDVRAYGQLVSEDPAPGTRPVPALIPVPDEGPHLSYSIQWFVFGALGFIAWGYLFVQEYRYGRSEAVTKKVKKRSADETFEDDLLDRADSRS